MTEDEVHDRIPGADLTDSMDTLVEYSHDTDLFLEVLLGVLFLVELGVGTWKGDLEVHESWRHQYLIRESHDPDTDPDDDDEEDDIEQVLRYPHNTLPHRASCRLLRYFRRLSGTQSDSRNRRDTIPKCYDDSDTPIHIAHISISRVFHQKNNILFACQRIEMVRKKILQEKKKKVRWVKVNFLIL